MLASLSMGLSSFLAAACAIEFLADLLRAARNDSSKNPLRYLEDKLGKYEKIADTILAKATYQTLDEWKEPFK
jgi:hypothetical protein